MHGQNINSPVCLSVCLSLCMSVTLSVNSPTGQTPQRIFTVDSLKDGIYARMCLLGSRWWIITLRCPKSPKTPILRARIGISSQICEKFKSLYLQICVSHWHDIWQAAAASNRDFVGGLVWWWNNSKMADGRHFENKYIAISQWKIVRFWWNFVHSSRF